MKHKTSELTGALLDAAVAMAEGVEVAQCRGGYLAYAESAKIHTYSAKQYSPSTDWAQGGPLIERERIQLMPWKPELAHIASWTAKTLGGQECHGDTALIAAMRAFVAHKLGDEVDL